MGSSSAAFRDQGGETLPARLRQGVRALVLARRAVPLPEPWEDRLPAAVRQAWYALGPYDQRHLVAVARRLADEGHGEHVVLAGLLHDIGKAGHISLAARTLFVLAAPLGAGPRVAAIRRIRRAPGLGGLHLLLHHAAAGADMLERAGLPPEVVWLVRHHERAIDHPGLRALRAADRRS
jgi:hypothetical protein